MQLSQIRRDFLQPFLDTFQEGGVEQMTCFEPAQVSVYFLKRAVNMNNRALRKRLECLSFAFLKHPFGNPLRLLIILVSGLVFQLKTQPIVRG